MIDDALRDVLVLNRCHEDDVRFLIGLDWCDKGMMAFGEGRDEAEKEVIFFMMHLVCDRMRGGDKLMPESYAKLSEWRRMCSDLLVKMDIERSFDGIKSLTKEADHAG